MKNEAAELFGLACAGLHTEATKLVEAGTPAGIVLEALMAVTCASFVGADLPLEAFENSAGRNWQDAVKAGLKALATGGNGNGKGSGQTEAGTEGN